MDADVVTALLTVKIVLIVGLVASTTLPLPVLVVAPVPPFNTGNAVPEYVIAIAGYER